MTNTASSNESQIERVLTIAGVRGVAPGAFLGLLKDVSESFAFNGLRIADKALEVLLLFKIGHTLFIDKPALLTYLSDLFRLSSNDIYQCDPSLNGLLYMSSAFDKRMLDANALSLLSNLVNELKMRQITVPAQDSNEVSYASNQTKTRIKWANRFGDLADKWFDEDLGLAAIYDTCDVSDYLAPCSHSADINS